jgi:hypothetical protein
MLMETIVHIRELIQILVYLGAFTLYLLWVKAPRSRLVRPIAVLLAGLAIGAVFTLWSNATITHIGTLVAERREQLVETVFSLSLIDLLRPPLPIFSDFVAFYTTTFWGWMPFLLIATPFALRHYRTNGWWGFWQAASSATCSSCGFHSSRSRTCTSRTSRFCSPRFATSCSFFTWPPGPWFIC